jgi:AcrR family transcriptional regulator
MPNGTKLPRKRGRPREFITSEVLERVREVFWAKGFAATSLDDLAKASGLNRPSLYAAFGDKEDLYIATLKFYGERSIAQMDQVMGSDLPIEERVGRIYKAAIDLYTAPPHRPGCLIVGTAAVESPSHPEIGKVAAGLLAGIEKSFEKGFANSSLKKSPSPAERAHMAGALMYAMSIRARLGARTADLRKFAAEMIPVVCR